MLTTIVIVMVIYFAVMALLGYLGKKHSSTFESHLNMARTAGPMMVICSAVGTHIGNGFIVGGAADGASIGLGGAVYGLGCALSYIIVGATVSNFLYKGNYVSLKDYLYQRYGDRVTGIIYDISTTLSYIGNVGAQLMAGYALFEALGFNGAYGVIAIAVIVFVYTQFAGLWGAFSTSVIQTIIIFASLVVTSVVILMNGGIDLISSTNGLPDGYFKLVSMSIPAFIGLTLPTTISTLVDQCVVQRINSAKDAKTAVWGHIWAGFVLVPLAFLPAFIGMYGHAVYGATDNSAFFLVLLNDLPAVLAALAVCAVLAAVMSTISGMYTAFSATIVKDIYHDIINPKAGDKQLKIMSTGLSVITTICCILIALFADSIIDLLCATYVFIGAACLIPFLGGIIWKKATAAGAVVSSIVGVMFCVLDMIGVFHPTYESIFPLIPAAAAYIVVSLATQKKSQEGA